MRAQLIGYGPDMAQRIAHAKELLAAYEKEKGKIDWSKIKLQCATTIKFSCENAQVVQQLLKKINVNIGLEPMLFSQLRANEVSGNYWLSLLGQPSTSMTLLIPLGSGLSPKVAVGTSGVLCRR